MKALTFKIGAEHFSLDIGYLKEVKPFSDLKNTYVPNSPQWLKGLVNLRGNLIPVVDLGTAFNINEKADNGHKVIILSIGYRKIGVLVDSIGTIIDIDNNELERPPSTISKAETKYIAGVKRLENALLVHLLPENLINIGGGGSKDIEKRKYQRKTVDILASYAIASEALKTEWRPCRIMDISIGGIKMLSKELNLRTRLNWLAES
ncbi:MAG: purine-binding chemotaxis protein CheW [Nitrospirae bacterium]|nr:purine-binding chemotaxis protein CheW [Nitrospirota bacterium]